MTFETTPDNYQSVNDILVYVVYDANAVDPTKTDYKYVAEIWCAGAKVHTMRTYPNPVNNRGIFDTAAIVRESITPTLTTDLGTGKWWINVQVKIREEYNGTVGAIVATSTEKIFFNTYNGRVDTLTGLSSYTNKVLSNRPTTIYLPSGCATFYLPYFAASASSFNVTINGTTTSVTPAAANSLININIANSLTSDYTVVINGVTYNVVVYCSGLYDNYIVHFLNKFGGFESVLFNKVSKKTFDIERKSFQQLPYRVSSSGVVSIKSSNIMYEQKTMFGVKFNEKLRVSTDLLSTDEWAWLSQLVCSPMAYIQQLGISTLYPMAIAANNYEFKQTLVDGLQQLTLDVEFNNGYKTQYR
jgi:hypothetical protein